MLDSVGAREFAFGDDLPYRADAWAQAERGERPGGDELAEAFFHLARIEERAGKRDRRWRFLAAHSCLDPLDPPLEKLRARLGIEPPRWGGGRFAVALTHDVDVPWRWTRRGILGGAARLKGRVLSRQAREAVAEATALAQIPLHKVRGTDPNWTFEKILEGEAARGVSSTFFVMAGHAHPADGPHPTAYEKVRPRLVSLVRERAAEVGLHGSYTAAEDQDRLGAEKDTLESLAGSVQGQRYHFLRVDPHKNLAPLEDLGFTYDSSLGFPDAPGFRAGIAHPFRPWDLARDRRVGLVEVPLAAMDVTLGEERYLGLSVTEAEGRLTALLDWAAENGGGFALLWHSEWFDERAFPGWGELYFRLLDGVQDRGGVCMTAGELAGEAAEWLP